MASGTAIILTTALLASLAACGPIAADRAMSPAASSGSSTTRGATGATAARVEAARSEARAVRADTQETSQRVALDAATSDLRVGRDVAILALADEHVRWLEAFLEETRERYRRGLATRTDVAQVESRLAQARAIRARAQGNLRISESRYLETVGEPPPGSDLNKVLPPE